MLPFVDLSLFYFVRDSDGYVLWGEGLVSSQRATGPSVSSKNLGDGLRVLRVVNELSVVTTTLQSEVFNYRQHTTTAIHLGLKARPPVMALPEWHTLGTTTAAVLHQFVRTNKGGALGATHGGQGPGPSEELDRILARAQQVIGFDFRGADAPCLGDVVLLEDAALQPPPVSFTTERGSDAFREAVRVDIEPHARQSDLMVNLRVIGSDNAVLDDVLVHWKPGMEPSFVLPTNQRFGAVELRVWRGGRLIWMQEMTFILEAGITGQLVSGTTVLKDRLTDLLERSIQAGNAPAGALQQTQMVNQHATSFQTLVGANLREPWRQAFLAARGEVFELAPPSAPAGEYFPQGGGGRATAILAFVKLVESGRSFLVDPFFDALGAADLLPRISGDVDMTVVTSLPDDDQRSCERLVAYLNDASGYLPHGIKVRRVTRSDTSEPAFHDRYLIVMGGEGPPRGYLLSNSFSGLARKYPMVVAEMSSGTTAAVLRDIERLLDSKNVTALWPLPGPGPVLPDPFGMGWRWYLGRLAPRAGRTETDWLAEARARGWLHADGERNPHWSTERVQDVLELVLARRRRMGAHLRRPGRRRKRHGRPRLVPLGFRIAVLGERAARGLRLGAADVAARLSGEGAYLLSDWLRSSFRQPDTWERHGHWRTRMSVHQALRDTVLTHDRVRYGLTLWSESHVAMDLTYEFGRAFVYQVLSELRAELAVGVGVDLGDPTFIAAVLDWQKVGQPWSPALTQAALSSASTMVRALGVQSLAAPTHRGWRSPLPEPPAVDAAPLLLRRLEAVEPTVVAFACLEWAPRVPDVSARRNLMLSVVQRLPNLREENVRGIAAVLVGNRELLASTVDVLPDVPADASALLVDAVATSFAESLSGLTDDYPRRELAKCAPVLASVLLFRHDGNFGSAWASVEGLLELAHARSQVEHVSPFRRLPDWAHAIATLAFGQLLALYLRSASGDAVDIGAGPLWSHVAEASPALFDALTQAVQEL